MLAISINLGSTFLIAFRMPENCNGKITNIATSIGAFKVDNQIRAKRIIDIVGTALIIDVRIVLTFPTPLNSADKIANIRAKANDITNDNKILPNVFRTLI